MHVFVLPSCISLVLKGFGQFSGISDQNAEKKLFKQFNKKKDFQKTALTSKLHCTVIVCPPQETGCLGWVIGTQFTITSPLRINFEIKNLLQCGCRRNTAPHMSVFTFCMPHFGRNVSTKYLELEQKQRIL